jgi:hypothetical protein
MCALCAVSAGERGPAFTALADMASSLAAVGCQEGFEGYLGAIAAQVRGGGHSWCRRRVRQGSRKQLRCTCEGVVVVTLVRGGHFGVLSCKCCCLCVASWVLGMHSTSLLHS